MTDSYASLGLRKIQIERNIKQIPFDTFSNGVQNKICAEQNNI